MKIHNTFLIFFIAFIVVLFNIMLTKTRQDLNLEIRNVEYTTLRRPNDCTEIVSMGLNEEGRPYCVYKSSTDKRIKLCIYDDFNKPYKYYSISTVQRVSTETADEIKEEDNGTSTDCDSDSSLDM